MSTLQEIRARIAQHQQNKQILDETKPITYEQYKMWTALSRPTSVTDKMLIVNERERTVDNHLYCPICNSDNMHHIGIELFNRNEDEETGEHIQFFVKESQGWSHTNVSIPEHSIDDNMKNNPSDRRSGIYIKFVCEDCQHITDLAISQDRGHTLMNWRYNK